jgi:hypothetical protein
MNSKPHILFVYNADSGIFNTVTDIAHKIFSPATYSCNLCAITYGSFGIRTEWKEYLESLRADFEFLHRDELVEKYGRADVSLPAVLLKTEDTVQELIGTEEINRCKSLEDLKQLISAKLAL